MYICVDFGTVFSQCAAMYLGKPAVLLPPGEYGVPSVFYYDSFSGELVGQDALDEGCGTAAANLVHEVKMKLGESFVVDGKRFEAKDIVKKIVSAVINKAMLVARTKNLDEEIEGVVVTVPAKMTMQERSIIVQAIEECHSQKKLPVAAVLKEPVAAAISYFNRGLPDGKCVLVFDIGGGTCDVALVKADSAKAELFDVVDSSMERIGGRNWDEALAGYIARTLEEKTGARVKGNPDIEEKVRRAAVSCKHKLSDPFTESCVARVEVNSRVVGVNVTRSLFEEITMHLLNKCISCLREVYEKNAASCSIDEIVCVGGSSNMLQIEKAVKKEFPDCNVRLFEPEHAVVGGGAIYGDILKNNGGISTIKDVASFSYGVDSYRNRDLDHPLVINIIKKGDKLPCSSQRSFTPLENNQESVVFKVFESENSEEAYDLNDSNKRYIGSIRLLLPKHASKNHSITCDIGLNENGFLEVKAKEEKGREVNAQFQLEKF